jgi:hypothetical protein
MTTASGSTWPTQGAASPQPHVWRLSKHGIWHRFSDASPASWSACGRRLASECHRQRADVPPASDLVTIPSEVRCSECTVGVLP